MPEESGPEPGSKKTVSILLVEDQEMLRLGVKLSLQGHEDLELIGEATSGPEAVRLARDLNPDLILMDIGLPEFDGIVATRKIKTEGKSKVLILSSHGEDECLYPSLEAGADGYCLKELSKDSLLAAIRAVSSGGTWLDETIARRVINAVKTSDSTTFRKSQPGLLNHRERELLNLLLEGKSTEVIAQELNISSAQVHESTKTVLQKLAEKAEKIERNYSQINEEERISNSTSTKNLSSDYEPTKRCRFCHSKIALEYDYCPADGETAIVDNRIGSIFANRYEILSLIGSGTGGSVYKARHRYLKFLASIKILHSDLMRNLELLHRFRLEAASICSLDHPNIITVKDFGISEEGDAFMIMEYFEGNGLDQILEKEYLLEYEKAIVIFAQICDGMQAAHEKGILHRDLKPSNILIHDMGNKTTVAKVADFGTAKILKGESQDENTALHNITRTQAGQVLGTPIYMSPEQCQSRTLSPASDIYSLGCLMYQCLSGQPPINGKDYMEVMYKHVYEIPQDLAATSIGPALPEKLKGLVMKTLNKNSSSRPQKMKELKADLLSISI